MVSVRSWLGATLAPELESGDGDEDKANRWKRSTGASSVPDRPCGKLIAALGAFPPTAGDVNAVAAGAQWQREIADERSPQAIHDIGRGGPRLRRAIGRGGQLLSTGPTFCRWLIIAVPIQLL